MHRVRLVIATAISLLAGGCENAPSTNVVIDNKYPASAAGALIVYDAYWQAVSFQGHPVAPGSSSDPQITVPASENTAYVVLAPGWDPTSSTPPTSFVALQSKEGFGVHLGDTVHIPVDDTTFIGNCAAGIHLSQYQADFITKLIFPIDFAMYSYDAANCTTTPIADAGSD